MQSAYRNTFLRKLTTLLPCDKRRIGTAAAFGTTDDTILEERLEYYFGFSKLTGAISDPTLKTAVSDHCPLAVICSMVLSHKGPYSFHGFSYSISPLNKI